MFQLSISLSLILNIIDLKEANARKCTFNICISFIALMTIVGSYFEMQIDDLANEEHLAFEAIGLIVLCLVYFSTCIELLRKLRIFVLEETLKETRLVQFQFLIFFVAYTSKIITLCYWIKYPPHSRYNVEGFLINTEVMGIVWVMIPVMFLLCMHARAFGKMRDEKMQLLMNVETDKSIAHPDDQAEGDLNKSELDPFTPRKD